MIHATAVVHPGVELASDVEIGPYAIIGEHVKIEYVPERPGDE